MSNQTDHTIVRLRVPPELKKKIEESAEQNNRSQSAEMVARLEESFLNQPMSNIEMMESLKNLQLELMQNKAIQDELMKTQHMLIELLDKKKPS